MTNRQRERETGWGESRESISDPLYLTQKLMDCLNKDACAGSVNGCVLKDLPQWLMVNKCSRHQRPYSIMVRYCGKKGKKGEGV